MYDGRTTHFVLGMGLYRSQVKTSLARSAKKKKNRASHRGHGDHRERRIPPGMNSAPWPLGNLCEACFVFFLFGELSRLRGLARDAFTDLCRYQCSRGDKARRLTQGRKDKVRRALDVDSICLNQHSQQHLFGRPNLRRIDVPIGLRTDALGKAFQQPKLICPLMTSQTDGKFHHMAFNRRQLRQIFPCWMRTTAYQDVFQSATIHLNLRLKRLVP